MKLFWYFDNKSFNPQNKKEKIDIKKDFLIQREITYYLVYVINKSQKPH